VRSAGAVVELATSGARAWFDVVYGNPGPKSAEREEMQLHEVALAAVQVVVLGAVNRLAPMFGQGARTTYRARTQPSGCHLNVPLS